MEEYQYKRILDKLDSISDSIERMDDRVRSVEERLQTLESYLRKNIDGFKMYYLQYGNRNTNTVGSA